MPWPISLHVILTIPYLLLYWYVGTKLTNAFVHGVQYQRRKIKKIFIILAVWPVGVPLILFIGHYIDRSWALGITLGEIRILDYLLLYPFWVGLVCVAQLGLIFFLSEIVRLIFFRSYRRAKERWLRIQGKILLALTALVVCYVAITIHSDTSTVRISEREYCNPHLPKSLDGFRIVHVSDIQIDDRTNGKIFDNVIRDIRLLNPDLTIFTGDLVTGGTRYIEQGARIIGDMDAKYGTYACIGNHEIWVERGRVEKDLRQNGVKVLVDTASIIHIGTSKIELREIDNFFGYRVKSIVFPKCGTDSADLRIMFTHSVARWLVDSASAHHYDIFLGGHSHGGQVAPGIPWWTLIMSRVQTPYVSGFYTAGSMLVSVTNGIGLTVAPFRFQAPAEISVIVVRSR
jgi:predicted MPP superfamily phosphohydrolase